MARGSMRGKAQRRLGDLALPGGRYVRWEFPRLQIDDGLALVADLRKQVPPG